MAVSVKRRIAIPYLLSGIPESDVYLVEAVGWHVFYCQVEKRRDFFGCWLLDSWCWLLSDRVMIIAVHVYLPLEKLGVAKAGRPGSVLL